MNLLGAYSALWMKVNAALFRLRLSNRAPSRSRKLSWRPCTFNPHQQKQRTTARPGCNPSIPSRNWESACTKKCVPGLGNKFCPWFCAGRAKSLMCRGVICSETPRCRFGPAVIGSQVEEDFLLKGHAPLMKKAVVRHKKNKLVTKQTTVAAADAGRLHHIRYSAMQRDATGAATTTPCSARHPWVHVRLYSGRMPA